LVGISPTPWESAANSQDQCLCEPAGKPGSTSLIWRNRFVVVAADDELERSSPFRPQAVRAEPGILSSPLQKDTKAEHDSCMPNPQRTNGRSDPREEKTNGICCSAIVHDTISCCRPDWHIRNLSLGATSDPDDVRVDPLVQASGIRARFGTGHPMLQYTIITLHRTLSEIRTRCRWMRCDRLAQIMRYHNACAASERVLSP